MEEMIEVVQRDLEHLLNTRQTHVGLPEAFKEVHNSIVTYGLPDFIVAQGSHAEAARQTSAGSSRPSSRVSSRV